MGRDCSRQSYCISTIPGGQTHPTDLKTKDYGYSEDNLRSRARSTHQNYYGYSGDNLRSRGRFLYPIQQITLNERGFAALCLGLILLVCFIRKTTHK
ncbi:MAG: hypothetical protein HFP77_03555 [Methylococcales symbiont of Iophon sp. n. MRB-2018]|nr:MAG: hypothetical protein HFP77_03555 [Methylococcales symbiont of Iophon sp. n. MRB-2018]